MDIFFDMFPLNAIGGKVVARSVIKCGLVERLRLVGVSPNPETPRAEPGIAFGAR